MASFDVAVIGGGPGGYVAAIRAAQLGLRVALFERERLGGLCLNWGCIPTKAILRNVEAVNTVREASRWGITLSEATYDLGAAIDRSREVVEQLVGGVARLLDENGVTVFAGEASLAGVGMVACAGERHETGKIIIATGAGPRLIPGLAVDGKVVVTSREALELRTAPPRVVVIGGGPVGVEFAHAWASYGSQVTIVEMLDNLLPQEDPDVGRGLRRSFTARGITCHIATAVEGAEVRGGVATVALSAGAEKRTVEAELVLVAVGFIPHTAGLNLESAGVATDRGFITIDDHMETNVPGIYAVGDVTGRLMLAHVATQQGVVAAEHIAGRRVPALDYVQMPRATFAQPQAGSIGLTEPAAKAAGYTVKVGRFPLAALGKAVTAGHTEGFVKVVADADTGQVLGVHMLGHDINELLGEATIVALLEATATEVGFAVHAHPTLGEALKEAALAVNGEAIHVAHRRL